MKTDVVHKLWELYEARNWHDAEQLFAENAVMTWHTSNERFTGSKAIIGVNRNYPEGWRIEVLEIIEIIDERVFSIIKVTHPPDVFFATSIFEIENDRIQKLDEFWATCEKPPAWRNAENLEGYEYYG